MKTKELVKKSTGESSSDFVERADKCLGAANAAGRDAVKAEIYLADAAAQTTVA